MPAPIALFVYSRVDHLRQTVEALQKNKLASESELFIYSDAAKNETAQAGVAEVRTYIRTITGFKNIQITERTHNLGLSKSIISGVTELTEKYGRVIVLEDDIVTTPYFLRYMNDGLDLYENEPRVASIHGFIYPVKKPLPETFFLRGADCWGWATWKRAWAAFDGDGAKLLARLETEKLTKEFDLDGSFGFTHMLERNNSGEIDSWAVRWHASAFLRNMLTLYPGTSLVDNIGQGVGRTHGGAANFKYEKLVERPIKVGGIAIEEDRVARQVLVDYFRSRKPSLLRRIFRKLKTT